MHKVDGEARCQIEVRKDKELFRRSLQHGVSVRERLPRVLHLLALLEYARGAELLHDTRHTMVLSAVAFVETTNTEFDE